MTRVHSSVANVIFWCFLLSNFISQRVDGFEESLEYNSLLSLSLNRVKRQQVPFPLDQIFQVNAAELGSATQVDVTNDFGIVPNVGGNDITDTQDVGTPVGQQRQPQLQLSQIFSNLIEAAAVRQTSMPQQFVRTVMNSGLRR